MGMGGIWFRVAGVTVRRGTEVASEKSMQYVCLRLSSQEGSESKVGRWEREIYMLEQLRNTLRVHCCSV